MSHWAEIDSHTNRVIRVLVGDNNDPEGDEGYNWLLHNLGGVWVKTSYNSNIRGKFAGVGDMYDAEKDIFVVPQPFPSWVQDGSFWKAPTNKPTDGKLYEWNESTLSWDLSQP